MPLIVYDMSDMRQIHDMMPLKDIYDTGDWIVKRQRYNTLDPWPSKQELTWPPEAYLHIPREDRSVRVWDLNTLAMLASLEQA